jgi:hypothetical protein
METPTMVSRRNGASKPHANGKAEPPDVGRLVDAAAARPAPAAPPDAVVARCLAKAPHERFQSAADLDRALARCGCAADWSAERAAAWWQAKTVPPKRSGPNPHKALQVKRT